jgi:hypothetical protein
MLLRPNPPQARGTASALHGGSAPASDLQTLCSSSASAPAEPEGHKARSSSADTAEDKEMTRYLLQIVIAREVLITATPTPAATLYLFPHG